MMSIKTKTGFSSSLFFPISPYYACQIRGMHQAEKKLESWMIKKEDRKTGLAHFWPAAAAAMAAAVAAPVCDEAADYDRPYYGWGDGGCKRTRDGCSLNNRNLKSVKFQMIPRPRFPPVLVMVRWRKNFPPSREMNLAKLNNKRGS